MRIILLVIMSCFLFQQVISQRDRLHIDLDRYSFRIGDTLRLKAYILRGPRPSNRSTDMYVRLLSESGIEISKTYFPVFTGRSAGQVTIPYFLPTGNYFLQGYTASQVKMDGDIFTVPLTVYNPAAPKQIFRKVGPKRPYQMTNATIKGISWLSSVQNGKISTQVEVDSGSKPRHLLLILPEGQDSAFSAEKVLSGKYHTQFAIFPLPQLQDEATLYLYEDSILIGRQHIRLRPHIRHIKIHLDTLSGQPYAYNSWTALIPDANVYSASISVTDADRSISSRRSINELSDSYTDDFTRTEADTDTSFLSYNGVVTSVTGKAIQFKDRQRIVAMAVSDTSAVYTKILPLDTANRFRFDSLLLFSDNTLDVQLEGDSYRSDYNVTLFAKPWALAPFDPKANESYWDDDTLEMSDVDTAISHLELKDLKEKYLKGQMCCSLTRLYEPPTKVDSLNTNLTTPMFSGLSSLMIDPSKETTSLYLESFFRSHVSQISFDAKNHPTFEGKPVSFYLDEQPTDWDTVNAAGFYNNLSFIKIFQNHEWSSRQQFSDQMLDSFSLRLRNNSSNITKTDAKQPPGKAHQLTLENQMVVCLYTKTGENKRTLNGQLHQAIVTGYSPYLPFHPNNVTLFWQPFGEGNVLPIRFLNSKQARRFRLKIEGVTLDGNTFHYEAFIDPKRKQR